MPPKKPHAPAPTAQARAAPAAARAFRCNRPPRMPLVPAARNASAVPDAPAPGNRDGGCRSSATRRPAFHNIGLLCAGPASQPSGPIAARDRAAGSLAVFRGRRSSDGGGILDREPSQMVKSSRSFNQHFFSRRLEKLPLVLLATIRSPHFWFIGHLLPPCTHKLPLSSFWPL
jgi:hypothetical protein